MTPCPLCGHATRLIHQKSFNIDFHQCLSCDFLFKDPKDYITPEEEKTIYDRHDNTLGDPAYLLFFQPFIERCLLPYVAKKSHGLDYGSGPQPVLASHLKAEYGFSMDLYDLFYQPDLPPSGKKYDFITCTEVIEHISDPLASFKILKSYLKPGGILAMMTLFHRGDDAFFMNWHYMRDLSHISFFTEKTMALLAEKTGLDLIYTDHKRTLVFKK